MYPSIEEEKRPQTTYPIPASLFSMPQSGIIPNPIQTPSPCPLHAAKENPSLYEMKTPTMNTPDEPI
jgi:hypothetical protein